ncbi:outer membrane adhesin-like protein, partial [Candidatus Magnetomorum sp. HK-1]
SINGQVIAHDVDQDNLTFNILALPEKGAITINSTTGQFIYVPYANKNGNDFFTFQANDSHIDSSLATISISITPVNDSPLITDMQRQGNENKAYYFTSSDFSDEFSDIDLDSISSVKITHLPEFGNLCQHESPISLYTELSLSDLSALNFKPLTDWSGKTSFTWKAFDGTNWSENEASVILEINADPLVIGPIIKNGTEDNYLYFDNADFQKFNFNSKCYIKIVSLPLHGNLYFDIQKTSQDHFFDGTPVYAGQEWHISDFLWGELVFLPDLNFNGLTSFLWSARKNNIWTDEEIVKIEILPINDRPEITSLYKEALEDTAIEFVAKDFTDIYHDIENDPLYEISFNQLPAPDMGQLMLKGKAVIKGNPIANTELDQLVFEPSMHGNGEILCTFIASDSMSWSITPAELKILIIPVGDTPRVPNITSLEDTATEPIIIQKHIKDGLEIKSFFIDHIMGGHLFMADGTTLITNQSFINTNDALKGVIFMPDQNRTNECGFDTWSSEDSQNLAAQSDAAHVSIRIIPVDDPPYVANALPAVNLPEDAALVEYDLTDVFTDVDNDLALMEYKIKVISNPDLLTAHISNQKLSLEFYPNAHGIADILIEAHSNGKISQDYCYVTINPVQDVPIAENIHIQTLENIPVSSNLIAHDADEDSLTFQIIKNGDKGLLSIHPQSGAFTYTPTKNMNGKDSFTFNAYDGIEHSNTATVSVYITAVNNDPLVDNFTMYGTEDTLLTFDLTDFSSAFTDIDDDLLYKIKIISLPDSSLGNLLINDISLLIHTELTHSEISNLYFMPRPNQFGVTEFLWQAFDGKSWSSSTGKCQIEISSVNDQPVAIDSQIFTGKQGDTIFGQLSFEDVDDDILDFSIQRQPEYGQLVLNNSESGQFMYIPDNDHIHLSDNFSYHIFDGHVYSNTANVYFSFEKNTPEEPPLIVRLYGDYNDGDIYTLTLISPETGEVVFNENGSTYELVLHISPGTYRLILFGKNYKPLDYPELIVLGEDTLICDLNLETDPFSSFYPGIEVSHIENSNGFKLCVIKKNIYELKMTIRTSDNEEIPVFEPSYERSLQNNHGTVADPYYYIWTPSDPITQRTVQSITDQVTTYTVAFNFYDVFNPSETISSYTVIYQQFASPIDQKASQSETQFLFETPKESGGVYGESTLYIASGETNFYPLIGTTLHLTVKDTSGQDRLLSITIPPIPLKYMYLAHTDYLEYDLESDLITIENPGPHIQNNDLFKAIVHCYTFGGTAIGTGIQLHFEMAAGKYKGIEVMYNPMINGQRANFMDDENAPFIDIPMLLNPLSESYTQLVNKPDVWLYVQEKGDQEKGFRAEKLLVPAETNDDGLVYIKMNHLTAVGLGMGKMPFVEEEDKPVDDSSDGENSNCFLGTIWR